MTKGCRLEPSSTTRSSLHSKGIGTSLTRGAAILTLGIGVRPVLANSESLAGKALAESTIFRHTGSVTTLKQNSPVSRTFLSVCFSVPSGSRDCQRDHRRNDADHGEKGKRREISNAALVYSRCPADGARHYGSSEESINLTLFDDCRIELDIIENHFMGFLIDAR